MKLINRMTVLDRFFASFICCICLMYLPYLFAYTESFAFSSIRAADEMAFLRIVTEELFVPSLTVDYFRKFQTFGYGQSWWALLCLIILPGYLLDNEQVMFVAARLLSLIFFLGTLTNIYICLRSFIQKTHEAVLFFALGFCSLLLQISIVRANLIYSETAYTFFATLALLFLLKDKGTLSRLFSCAVISFCVALSIKSTPAPMGIMFLVYLAMYHQNIDVGSMLINVIVAMIALTILNPTLLHPELFKHYVNNAIFYGDVARHGWPDVQHVKNLTASIENFEIFYFNVYSLVGIVLGGAILYFRNLRLNKAENLKGNSGEKHLQQQQMLIGLGLPSLVSVTCFALFYVWLPFHFGYLITALFIPIAFLSITALSDILSCFFAKTQRRLLQPTSCYLALIGFVSINWTPISTNAQILLDPAPEVPRLLAIKTIEEGLKAINKQPKFVGVAHELGMPKINNTRPTYWMLNELPTHLVLKSDLLIFWRQDDKYRRLYTNLNPQQPVAYDNFNKITTGEVIGGSRFFKKTFEKDDIVFYEAVSIVDISEDKQIGNYGIIKAFDGSNAPNDFWEFPGGEKTGVTISYATKQPAVSSYMFVSGEEPSKMPSSWKVFTRVDDSEWELVDKQLQETNWSVNEARKYPISSSKEINAIRFEFTGGNNEKVLRVYEIILPKIKFDKTQTNN